MTINIATPPMHDYQKYAMNFIITHPYCGLFLEMGMGKTYTTLMALCNLNLKSHVLVIAPKNIARSTWIDEIEKWQIPFRTKSLIVKPNGKNFTKKERLAIYQQVLNDPPTVYFINRELIPDLVSNLPVWPFPNVVIDESQSFKTYNSKRFKALKSIRPFVKRMILLTGTPTPNGLMDLWSQIYLLDQGYRLGNFITRFREQYFYPTLYVQGHPVGWELKSGAESEIYRRISDIVISMKNTKLQLPELTMNDVYVHMDESEMKLYQRMKKDQVLTFDKVGDVTAVNAAVLAAKLSQMASGALYTDEKRNFKIIHKKKLEQVAYILRNLDSPAIIAYHFQSDLIMLENYLKDVGIDAYRFDGSPEMIHAWNEGKIPVMLLQPASAGHGLNLQQGGHTLIWYTMPWSLEEYLQCNARLYRQGQSEHTVIHHILCKGTIDERIHNILQKKDASQSALIEAVKAQI